MGFLNSVYDINLNYLGVRTKGRGVEAESCLLVLLFQYNIIPQIRNISVIDQQFGFKLRPEEGDFSCIAILHPYFLNEIKSGSIISV